MATLRERIEEEQTNSDNGGYLWVDPELGRFLIREVSSIPAGLNWRSEAVLKKYPNDADLEAAYARCMVEKGE